MKRTPMTGSVILPGFEEFGQPDVKPVKKTKTSATGKTTWTKVKPRHKCDECMSELAAAKGNGPAAHHAVWKQVTEDADGDRETKFLCYRHANTYRAGQGLDPLK